MFRHGELGECKDFLYTLNQGDFQIDCIAEHLPGVGSVLSSRRITNTVDHVQKV